jgi:uncharacterized membrane protein YhaH (DUF805 family)
MTTHVKKIIKKYVNLIKRIPERQYWPIFIILSLYFVVPMSEITVTLAAVLFFKFENKIRPLIAKLVSPLPDWLRYGGSIIFFLVMIDDTLFYFALIFLAFWSSKQVKKESGTDLPAGQDKVL